MYISVSYYINLLTSIHDGRFVVLDRDPYVNVTKAPIERYPYDFQD